MARTPNPETAHLTRLGNIKIPAPRFLLNEVIGCEIMIHLEHFGPMRQEEIHNSINCCLEKRPRKGCGASRRSIEHALRFLIDLGMVEHTCFDATNLRRAHYRLTTGEKLIEADLNKRLHGYDGRRQQRTA